MSAILLSTLSMHSMEPKKTKQNDVLHLNILRLPDEIITSIFSHYDVQDIDQVKVLENTIKNLLKLSITCKYFHTLLTYETIGAYCKNFTLTDKNETLKKLSTEHVWTELDTQVDFDFYYKFKRVPTIILVHAGADHNLKNDFTDSSLLSEAVENSDVQLIAALFKHHADPNQKYCCLLPPLFFMPKQ